jgi:hypothetical protein
MKLVEYRADTKHPVIQIGNKKTLMEHKFKAFTNSSIFQGIISKLKKETNGI